MGEEHMVQIQVPRVKLGNQGLEQFACIVYKALLQWRSFEAEKTNIFDRIIHTIYSSIEVVFLCHFTFDYNLAYLLSTTSTQSTLKNDVRSLLIFNSCGSFKWVCLKKNISPFFNLSTRNHVLSMITRKIFS
ncbi:unnamed protein product, partial [Vitis vinifera]